MSDNFPLTPGAGRNAATDEVTYSGDTADIQLVKIVQTTGAEGSKTVVDLPGDATNGLDVDVTRLPALVAGTANIGDVDVLTVPADPFGLTADAAVTAGATGSISAKLRSISRDLVANIVLAAGANAIGKLAANSGIDIGDVDVLSVIPGTGATNLGKAEDGAHTSGDVGVMALGVNNITPSVFSATDLDYVPIAVDQYGILRVTPLSVTYVLTRTADGNVYATGDCIASATSTPTVPTASGFGRNNAGSGRVERVVIRVSSLPATPYNLELIVHKSAHTQGNDNAAVALSDADNATIIAVVQLGGSPITLGANCLYQAEVDIPYVCGAGTTALWFELVCRSATTPGSADQFSIEFTGIQFN